MKKQRLIRTGILLLFCVVLAGICISNRPSGTARTEKTADRHITAPAKKTDTEKEEAYPAGAFEGTKDLQTAEQALLRIEAGAKSDIFGGYPVDESFLGWLGSRYGTDTLVKLADYMEKKDAGVNLWYEALQKSIHVLWSEYKKDYYASDKWDDIIWKEARDASCIRLDFIGDINLDSEWCTMKTAGSIAGVSDCISNEVKKELQSADFTMVNNEFVYTSSKDNAQDKEYIFGADKEAVNALKVFGTDMVSVANNHVFDYGKQGFLDTLDTLEKNKVVSSGGGKNLEEASAVHYVITGGRKIAIVSATEIERFSHYTKKAGENSPGVLKTQQKDELQAAIRTAKKNSDCVIVCLHWGAEGTVSYDSRQREIAELCAGAGADLLIGGHPHRLQGVSYVEGIPVAYSLGNFWFSTGALYTAIAQVQIDENGTPSLFMLPCVQRDTKTYLIEGAGEKKEFYHYLADVSSGVGIDEDGRIHAYKDVDTPGVSPYAYTSGRRYGLRFDDTDLDMHQIDFVGNIQ